MKNFSIRRGGLVGWFRSLALDRRSDGISSVSVASFSFTPSQRSATVSNAIYACMAITSAAPQHCFLGFMVSLLAAGV